MSREESLISVRQCSYIVRGNMDVSTPPLTGRDDQPVTYISTDVRSVRAPLAPQRDFLYISLLKSS